MRHPRRASMLKDSGFSLTEVVVSSALLLLVVAAAVAVANPVMDAAHSQPEAIDLHQRARVAAAALFRDLYAAGAGADVGSLSGSLGMHVATILPRRIGAESPDPSTVSRSDVVSVMWVPITRVQTTLVAPFSTIPMAMRQDPGCPFTQPACGAKVGMGLLLFDRSGSFDLLTVESVDAAGAVVQPRGPAPSHPYGDDAGVVEIEARTYYVDTAARQLRRYDTDNTDVPLMDDVVAMSLEYFGAVTPPATPKPPIGQANCLYDAAGQRLSGMSHLSPGEDGLAPLPIEMFGDGPWCGTGAMVYDADVLRVRRVRVTLRLQVSSPGLRATGDRFANAGTSRSASKSVPDDVVSFDVSPRNLEGVE
jgi:prepilin-type N-terminal cleavage/methylation domain-containing protein